MTVRLVEATCKDIRQATRQMKVFDSSSVEIIGLDSDKIMLDAFRKSTACWAMFNDEELLCVAGMYTKSLLDREAFLWLLATQAVEVHQFTFIRQSQIFIKDLIQDYRCIRGVVDARYERSIKWLRWLGFDVGKPIEFSDGHIFLPFMMKGLLWQTQ